MRCNNCGFINPAGRARCEKCNAPLSGSMVDQPSETVAGDQDGYSGTIKGVPVQSDPWDCPACSRPVIPGSGACNQCGHSFGASVSQDTTIADIGQAVEPVTGNLPDQDEEEKEKEKVPFRGKGMAPKGTIDPYQKGFRLKPVATEYEGEMPEVSFRAEEDIVELGRETLEPDNGTISSRQAAMINKNGKWYIKDESRHKSTYVMAIDYIELNDGDTIMMGNRKFVFTT